MSSDPDKRARQEANLVDAPPAPPGNSRALVHGGRATVAIPGLDDARREILDAFRTAAPVKDAGAVPAADAATIELAARAFARARSTDAWLAEHGIVNDQGEVYEAARYAERSAKTALALLKELGMTPRARASLFGSLAIASSRLPDLARQWADETAAEASGEAKSE